MNIKERISDIFKEITAIRRELHAHPELSEQEVHTSEKISRYLTAWGIEHKTGIAGYGIVAEIRGEKQGFPEQKFSALALRADMDALPIQERVDSPFCSQNPGVMHACGHDIHTAVLLGSARLLNEMKAMLPGTVRFFFQPAEETIGGAERMIQAGCMENPKIEAVLGLHVSPEFPAGCIAFCRGKMNAASTEFQIHVEGAYAHGAHPDQGIDPIVTAAHIVTALQTAVSRSLSPVKAGLVTVAQLHAGSKNNIIPREAELSGIIRALDQKTRELLKQRVEQIAVSCGKAFGAQVTVTFFDSYPALVNDAELEAVLEQVACQNFRKENIFFLQEPSLGTDDFSFFSNAAKGLYFNLGTRRKSEKHTQMLHSDLFDPDDSCIRSGILMEVMGTVALLHQKKGEIEEIL